MDLIWTEALSALRQAQWWSSLVRLVAQRQNSHTPDQKTLTAKRNWMRHPALPAAILGSVISEIIKFKIRPNNRKDTEN
jgi:hypothetical protein